MGKVVSLIIWYSKAVLYAVAVVVIVSLPQTARSQRKDKPVTKPAPQTKKPAEDLTHWKFFLDSLIIETRLVDPDEERPLLLAEVADAYWLVDQAQAKKLFTDAFDAAVAHKNQPIAPVLSKIARRDRALATELTKRLLEAKSEDSESAENLLRTARELFKTDPKYAIELAKRTAVLGPSMSGLSFLFEVARTDPAGAAEIYNAYIQHASRPRNSELRSLLWLAGYPFGYGEAYGGDSNDPMEFSGFMGVRVPGLKPQPDLAAAYLRMVLGVITNTMKRATEAGNPDKDVLNALALFATSYLFPEVQRYLPDAEASWSGLYRQALAGTPEDRRAAIEQRVRSIREVRARTSEQSDEEFAGTDAKEKLADIEKLPDTCSRDRAYAEAALAQSYAKDFTQARQVADRIENLELRDSVLQFTNYDEAAALLERGDFVRALERVEKVSAKEQRAVLYVRIASAALKKSDKPMVLDALNRARSLVRDSDNPQLQAGVLLSVGAVFAQFDASEATYVTRESVKAINRMEDRLDDTFSVLRQVNLNCAIGEIRWHGSRERVENFSFFDTLGAIAKSDAQAEGALALTTEIQDKPTRIRAQVAIVKAVIK